MSDAPRRGRSGGGRAARQAARAASGAETQAYLTRSLAPVSVLDEEGLAIIEENAEIILSEVGIQFNEFPLAIELLTDAGCTVDGEKVFFPKGLARKIVQDNAPSEYTQSARNPERNVRIGGNTPSLHPTTVPHSSPTSTAVVATPHSPISRTS